MTTTTHEKTQTNGYRVIGTRPIRHDGYDKVTGRAKYGADVNMAGLLEGAILRSPHPHARIRSIDTSKAEAFPGVKAVMTSADLDEKASLPANRMEIMGEPEVLSENAMARGKVLYKGHALAALAAINKHVAEEALQLIKVDYEVLPHVLDIREAMKPDAPILHDHIRFGEEGKEKPSNIAAHNQLKKGDIDEGFKEADVIVEREFETKAVHQGYVEPQNSTASWSEEGNLTIWTSTQGPFIVRRQAAAILNIPTSRVKVIPMEIGGGFGGKVRSYVDVVAAVLAKKCGHPVKIVMSRKEVFEGTGPASGSYIKCKAGATKDGRITAVQTYLAYGAGAFPGSSVASGSSTSLAPYKVENLLVDGYDVVMNTNRSSAYRAPGSPQAAFAVESIIDELAETLGIDPVEFRLKNVNRTGDRQASGVPFPSIGCVEVEEAMRDHPHYKSSLSGANQGRGIAVGYWGNAGMQSSVTLNVTSDGTITLISGSVDIGGSRAVLAMQAAEVLGITAEDVHPSVGDTDSVGFTSVTGGSRTAFATGLAAIAGAEDIKRQMIERAALLWETQPEDVDFVDGVFISKKNPEDKMTFPELASKLMGSGGLITASAVAEPKQPGPSFSGMIVDVEVDKETGKVDVLRATVFQDVGTAAHPSYVEGQMQGGVAQGIGWALNEEYFYNKEGAMANSSFLDYRMPTSLDVPMIDAVMIEVPNPTHPFGIRGVGESSIIAPMAAVANAVARATGARIRQLPISPGVILEATREQLAAK